MIRTCALVVGMVLASAGSVLAASEGGEKAGILDPKFDLGLWTIVIFFLLLAVLWKFAWGPMLQGLKRREASIKDAINEAKKLREDNARSEAGFKAQLDEAYAKIPALMEEARRDAANLKEQIRTEANAEVAKERQRLFRDLEIAKDQALKELWEQSANLATLISTKAIGRSLSAEDHRRLVDEALAEVHSQKN